MAPAWLRGVSLRSGNAGMEARSAMEKTLRLMWLERRAGNTGSRTNGSVYLAIGLAVGGVILLAIVAISVCLVLKQKEHKRAMRQMDEMDRRTSEMAEREAALGATQPPSILRRSSLTRKQGKNGWGALGSSEDMHAQYAQAPRSYVSLAKRMRARGIPLVRLKHLSAIIESPRDSPNVVQQEQPAVSQPHPLATEVTTTGNHHQEHVRPPSEDVFRGQQQHQGPNANIMHAHNVKLPRKAASRGSLRSQEDERILRSQSMGSLALLRNSATLKPATSAGPNFSRPRSLSLCSQVAARPPSTQAPPLPIIAPHSLSTNNLAAVASQTECSSLKSSSSKDSTGTSVLRASPVLNTKEQKKPLGSPTVEEVVAADDSAQLKAVPNGQWTSPHPAARPPSNHRGINSQTSIHSNIAQMSSNSLPMRRLSSASCNSVHSNRFSGPTLGAEQRMIMSRVTSTGSFKTRAVTPKGSPTRRNSRGPSVSEHGSPAERKRPQTNVLRDVSGNSMAPSRQASSMTLDSTHSSNGNPFQWDVQPLVKPSAMKGSPNARKGHKQQNCVRISTLTPQILGPPKRNSSGTPTIEEEAGDCDYFSNPSISVAKRRCSASAPNLRVQTLRASLTPSSPTLSAWMAYHDGHMQQQPSDTNLSASTHSAQTARLSQRSSVFNIPLFPSPGRATVSPIQQGQTVPEFCLTGSSPPASTHRLSDSSQRLSFNGQSFSSPTPMRVVSHTQGYDPAWPMLSIPAPQQSQEYDPTSPVYPIGDPERSSLSFPFATDRDATRSPISPISSRADSPPCSPKTIPEDVLASEKEQRRYTLAQSPSEAKLTSENASALLAQLENLNFPGAPVLPPPQSEFTFTPPNVHVTLPFSADAHRLQPLRAAPPPPLSLDDACVPSPLHLKTSAAETAHSPQGPRAEPAKSVLRHAMALRRMNSETSRHRNSESRRYVRLGRETSVELPFICASPDPNDSCYDLFDFDRASGEYHAMSPAQESSFDKLDIEDMERRIQNAITASHEDECKENAPPEEESDQQRGSTVWEDGEMFWERVPEDSVKRKSRGSRDLTPKSTLLTPSKNMNGITASIQQTPQSLYDAHGFLKT